MKPTSWQAGILKTLTGILESYFLDKVNEPLGLDTKLSALIKEHQFDSLDVVEFAMAIEDEFGIEVPDEHLMEFKTIGDIVAYIKDPKPKPPPVQRIKSVKKRVSVTLDEEQLAMWNDLGGSKWLKKLLTGAAGLDK